MLVNLLEGLLPGLRQLRPPLISGLFWALFFWLLAFDSIPERGEATGWTKQAYALFEAGGPVAIGVVLSVVVFGLGAMLSALSDALTLIVGRSASSLLRAVRWQRFAQRKRRELRRQVAEYAQRAEKAEVALAAEKDDDKRVKLEREASSFRTNGERLKGNLTLIERRGGGHILIPRSASAQQALGTPPAEAGEGLERELVDLAWQQGLAKEAEERKKYVTEQDTWDLSRRPDTVGLAEALQAELSQDPLEALRALSEPLYLDLDRERAERDVRVAIAVPAFFMAVLATARWSGWWILACLLPLWFILRYSFDAVQERTRVLRLIQLHDLKTPALRRAFDAGRGAARLVIDDWERVRESARERRLADASIKTDVKAPMP